MFQLHPMLYDSGKKCSYLQCHARAVPQQLSKKSNKFIQISTWSGGTISSCASGETIHLSRIGLQRSGNTTVLQLLGQAFDTLAHWKVGMA